MIKWIDWLIERKERKVIILDGIRKLNSWLPGMFELYDEIENGIVQRKNKEMMKRRWSRRSLNFDCCMIIESE